MVEVRPATDQQIEEARRLADRVIRDEGAVVMRQRHWALAVARLVARIDAEGAGAAGPARHVEQLRDLLTSWRVEFEQESHGRYTHLCVPLLATRFVFATGNGRFQGVRALVSEGRAHG